MKPLTIIKATVVSVIVVLMLFCAISFTTYGELFNADFKQWSWASRYFLSSFSFVSVFSVFILCSLGEKK